VPFPAYREIAFMDEQRVALTHDEALELLAFLPSSAQCCLREPPITAFIVS